MLFRSEARLLVECNQIDPFRRELHQRLGDALLALDDRRAAALEYEVAAAVPLTLDREYLAPGKERPAADDPAERAARGALWLSAGRLRLQIGDLDRGRVLLRRVLREAPGSDAASEAQSLLDSGDNGKK